MVWACCIGGKKQAWFGGSGSSGVNAGSEVRRRWLAYNPGLDNIPDVDLLDRADGDGDGEQTVRV